MKNVEAHARARVCAHVYGCVRVCVSELVWPTWVKGQKSEAARAEQVSVGG